MTATTAAAQVFRLPDLGEGLTEAEIIDWKVAVGDTVEVDQIVVEVETAKAAVEVPVPYAGTVLRLHAEVGAVLAVGRPLIEVGPADVSSAADRYREEEQAGSGNVLIGYGTTHATGSRRRRTRPRQIPEAVPSAPDQAPRVISPLVRKIAREHGLDLAAISPTGPRGVILRRDVEQAITTAAETPETPESLEAVGERIPLRGVRRAVADKLSRSRTEIPDATTWVDADATGLLAVRDALRRSSPGLGIGLLALLARVCVAGLRRFPELNSSVDTGRAEIVRHGHINLGFAAQTDRGLVVPVVRDAHLMTTAQLAAELARLTGLARSGALPPAAMTGGTFTLNNYGVFGVDGSTPIINHPEAALLGIGRIIDRPWVVDGAVVPRKVTQLSFTFDHRVCDGGTAGGFLRFVADCVEDPAILFAHV
ncbi:pyruvate dehydrogenase E2 component (dihydrolipoamide acetyltransferase) [Nonomuraea solani]|uniref:Dihydrolipoamide acetyltransferase component of pyruvate dehydrogenase complex n=1 Tax=Nonomuraea solani TaxID=1144553 RepID=A0A1H6ET40_9ACTN|nr:dihydrolipoamide acetyltransferase family protein [Nonomuraea solani]SEH00166.1 pyruvate dehydrogenase E2 component (dihydrolipoamide acetyltransferase) [Nonomuraea solani]